MLFTVEPSVRSIGLLLRVGCLNLERWDLSQALSDLGVKVGKALVDLLSLRGMLGLVLLQLLSDRADPTEDQVTGESGSEREGPGSNRIRDRFDDRQEIDVEDAAAGSIQAHTLRLPAQRGSAPTLLASGKPSLKVAFPRSIDIDDAVLRTDDWRIGPELNILIGASFVGGNQTASATSLADRAYDAERHE